MSKINFLYYNVQLEVEETEDRKKQCTALCKNMFYTCIKIDLYDSILTYWASLKRLKIWPCSKVEQVY